MNYGLKNDPHDLRIEHIIGYQRHCLDRYLSSKYFKPEDDDPDEWKSRLGIDNWSEGEVEKEFVAVNFQLHLPDFHAAVEAIRQLPNSLIAASFPELSAISRGGGYSALEEHSIRLLGSLDIDSIYRFECRGIKPRLSFCYLCTDNHRLDSSPLSNRRDPLDAFWFLFRSTAAS